MIDIHAHYLSPRLLELASKRESPVEYVAASRTLAFPTGSSRSIPAPLCDLEARSLWNLERDIDLQVVSPWMDATGEDLDPLVATDWCRMYNDSVAEDLKDSPRFAALAALPVSSGEAAATELERSMTQLEFVGGALPTQVRGIDLDVAGLDPLFSTAEGLDAPLFVHPFRVMAPDRMNDYFLSNICGNPFETTLAAMRLFFAGVFESWPRLKLILAHTGGALTILAGRAWHASNNASGIGKSLRTPGELLERFYYDSLLHDHGALAHAIGSVGPNRVMAGTDFPFPMLIDDPVAHVQTACARAGEGIGEATERVLTDNAMELFDL